MTNKPPEQRVFDVCRTFNEIQTGPNPLTPEEVRKLIELRPEVYGVLEAWAAQRNRMVDEDGLPLDGPPYADYPPAPWEEP